MVLTTDGALHIVDLHAHTSAQLVVVDLPDLAPDAGDSHFAPQRHRLHVSHSGAYVAVVVDRGRSGVVVETRSGKSTMQLDGGAYCEETVPFSACFLQFDGRDVFVHRTDWNRLDASDPASGRSLTQRFIAAYESMGEPPLHYLDYFHGQLLASPDGHLMFDDGWVWHPMSIPRIWSVAEWLRSNPWESEDGASVADLDARDDWTQPACWVDDERIAVWRAASEDDEAPEPQAHEPRLQMVHVSGAHLTVDNAWSLPGVQGVVNLLSDGKCLYVVSADGTTAWDLHTRARVADFPNFNAQRIDRTRNTLLAFESDRIQEVAIAC